MQADRQSPHRRWLPIFLRVRNPSLSLFDGGLRLHLDGEMQARGTRKDPWFDPELPVTLRLAYLGGQKIISDPLPMEVFVAADSLLVQLQLKKAALRGYVDLSVRQCRIR